MTIEEELLTLEMLEEVPEKVGGIKFISEDGDGKLYDSGWSTDPDKLLTQSPEELRRIYDRVIVLRWASPEPYEKPVRPTPEPKEVYQEYQEVEPPLLAAKNPVTGKHNAPAPEPPPPTPPPRKQRGRFRSGTIKNNWRSERGRKKGVYDKNGY